MAVNLNTAPSDEGLAMLWPNTLHTRWGQSAAGGGGIGVKGDDFTCLCSMCAKFRRNRWERDAQHP